MAFIVLGLVTGFNAVGAAALVVGVPGTVDEVLIGYRPTDISTQPGTANCLGTPENCGLDQAMKS